MKELVEKFQKMSAAQLITKMEKGVENETEKNVIIQILQKRGRDVTPYVGKTTEEIKNEVKLDEKQKKESAAVSEREKSAKVKVTKPAKEKTEKQPKEAKETATKRVRYEDEVFAAGVSVKSEYPSSRMAVGEVAVVKSTFYMEGEEDKKYATLKNERGEFLSRKLDQLVLA